MERAIIMNRIKILILILALSILCFCGGCSKEHIKSENAIISEAGIDSSAIQDTQSSDNFDFYDRVENDAWWDAYLEIICNLQEYLVDTLDYRSDPELYNPMDEWIYLGLHDFDGDLVPELLVGDGITMAVFTFSDGKVEKLEDLYHPDAGAWCINGVYFRDNSISVECDGADGADFVNFGFLDEKYVIGFYSQLSLPSVVKINGEESTLEEMDRIYPTDFDERILEDRKEKIRLVNEDGVWILIFPSEEQVVLNQQFEYSLIMW